MKNCFQVLGIQETTDQRAIKKAYAVLARKYHPEEDPEEFKRIHQAYEEALEYAKSGKSIPYEQTVFQQEMFEPENVEEKRIEHEPEQPAAKQFEEVYESWEDIEEETLQYEKVYETWESKEKKTSWKQELYDELFREYEAKGYQIDLGALIKILKQKKYKQQLQDLENQALILDAVALWPKMTKEHLMGLRNAMNTENTTNSSNQSMETQEKTKPQKRSRGVFLWIFSIYMVYVVIKSFSAQSPQSYGKRGADETQYASKELESFHKAIKMERYNSEQAFKAYKQSVEKLLEEMEEQFSSYDNAEKLLKECEGKKEKTIVKEGKDRINKVNRIADKIQEKLKEEISNKSKTNQSEDTISLVVKGQKSIYVQGIKEITSLYVTACTNLEHSFGELRKRKISEQQYDDEYSGYETELKRQNKCRPSKGY